MVKNILILVENDTALLIRHTAVENSNGLLIYTADETTMKFRHNEIISYPGSAFAVAAYDNSGVDTTIFENNKVVNLTTNNSMILLLLILIHSHNYLWK